MVVGDLVRAAGACLGLVWGLPNTLLGLAFAGLSLTSVRYARGVLVAESTRGLARVFLSRRGYSAITLGRVMITTVPLTPALWVHELTHLEQSERWGLLFLPAYLYWYFRAGYHDNPFERAAVERAQAFLSGQATGSGPVDV
mgnify:CR=1 FL=1